MSLSVRSIRLAIKFLRAESRRLAPTAAMWRDQEMQAGEQAFVERVKILQAIRELIELLPEKERLLETQPKKRSGYVDQKKDDHAYETINVLPEVPQDSEI